MVRLRRLRLRPLRTSPDELLRDGRHSAAAGSIAALVRSFVACARARDGQPSVMWRVIWPMSSMEGSSCSSGEFQPTCAHAGLGWLKIAYPGAETGRAGARVGCQRWNA